MKKVLIIGGNGFIGSNLSNCLIKHKYEVYSFDIQLPRLKVDDVNYIVGDFFDDECLEKAITGMDVIIHSLSTVNPGNSNERFMQGYSRDFVQSVKLFDMCIKKNIKVIFLSSGGTVYGIQDEQPIKETALPAPINHYGAVKLCIENVMRTFNIQLHTKMLIARISNPYGPGQDFHKGVGFVDASLKKTLRNETIEIWGDGNVVRDYIYIEDVCEMLCSLIEYDGDEEVFNLSSNEGMSLNDIIEEIKLLGLNPNVVYKPARSVDVPKVILDNSKIMKVHSMKIRTFREGLKLFYHHLVK
ncbi:NAD-dependent epimerase/dehydratase family protein [Sharpea azabuensis]|uniref:UDP-glucose 4-epimerase n=1 Tax=Sharpea azabuensis TaxID=322505 RepID=A0A1H6V2F7_9FIRM|nr:NAD-dependent epimerase/dehydratase family protein [Sharpea azabuensis]SEI94432.1 UDP-glucose 4-epimerase [Sharpea azabuensis]